MPEFWGCIYFVRFDGDRSVHNIQYSTVYRITVAFFQTPATVKRLSVGSISCIVPQRAAETFMTRSDACAVPG